MPTFTIDLPDNWNIPANWDARSFVMKKLYEAGMISSDQVAPSAEEDNAEVDVDTDSYFTPELREQIARNRKRLDEEYAKNPPKRSDEEYHQLLLNGPVADEEEIQALEEIQEMRRRWTSP